MKNSKRTLHVIAASALLCGTGFAHAGNGPAVAIQKGAVTCFGFNATVQIEGAVTATAAAPAAITVSTGGDFLSAGQISQWTSYGRTKAAEFTLAVTIPGELIVPVSVCVAQPGANRSACATLEAHECIGWNGSGGDIN